MAAQPDPVSFTDDPAFADLISLFLIFLSDRTGNQAYLRSARALRQLPPGLPAIDDQEALDEASDLLAGRHAASTWQACLMVAKARCCSGDPISYAKRLHRKLPNFRK